MTNEQPCAREDLVAIRPSFAYWSVDEDGTAVSQVTDYDDDIGDIEEYLCENCNECFCPDKPHHIDEAWREALEHVKEAV